MSDLYTEEIDVGRSRPVRHFINDVTLLFNQQRIDKLGTNAADVVNAWLSRLNIGASDPLAELRSKCTDEQLISIVKSRHIQSPSELAAWSSFLSSNIDTVLAELANANEPQPTGAGDPAPAAPASSE